MKRILFTLVLVLMAVAASAQTDRSFTRSTQLIATDTLDAATQWSTMRKDSLLLGLAYQIDSVGYADARYDLRSKSQQQAQIEIYSYGGYRDTLRIEKLERGGWIDGVGYDSVWTPIPYMDLQTAAVDTGYFYVKYGPHLSTKGVQVFYTRLLLYDAFTDNRPWRIVRYSGAGHPQRPDASKTHKLIININRRETYGGAK